jgi:prepilin-type N-terminal cleavage/methylation domain-containing protein
MLYRFLLSKKGYSFVEVLIVVVILGILVAVGVPIFVSGYRAQAVKDCNNQKTIISTLFGEVTTGMMDSGKTQSKVDFSRVPSGRKTTYPGDGVSGNKDDAYVGKSCFLLTDDPNAAFTIGDIRGGYFGLEQWNSYPEVVRAHGQYDEYNTEKYDIGVDRGYYLKKKAMENEKFYLHFTNEEIPVCPFADFDNSSTTDDYRYYIFEDGTVFCTCPHCNE